MLVCTLQTTLTDVFQQFTDAVAQWQTFWDVVDEIDGSTCVLDPEKPTRAATYRRIALGLYCRHWKVLHRGEVGGRGGESEMGPEASGQ